METFDLTIRSPVLRAEFLREQVWSHTHPPHTRYHSCDIRCCNISFVHTLKPHVSLPPLSPLPSSLPSLPPLIMWTADVEALTHLTHTLRQDQRKRAADAEALASACRSRVTSILEVKARSSRRMLSLDGQPLDAVDPMAKRLRRKVRPLLPSASAE